MHSAPRVFVIPAVGARQLAVIRRGPSRWAAVGRWDFDRMTYDAGDWIKATIYPQRCDLSPDGLWLAAFILDPRATWAAGTAYLNISRLPSLDAQAAWEIGSTWTNGVHFVEDPSSWPLEEPAVGDPRPCRSYGLRWTRAASFAVERRRGWIETPDTPARDDDDAWDQRRQVTMQKQCPQDVILLKVTGWYAAFRAFEPDRFGASSYWLESDGERTDLTDVQWADWASDGQLLVATKSGHLEVRAANGVDVGWQHDLAAETPPTA